MKKTSFFLNIIFAALLILYATENSNAQKRTVIDSLLLELETAKIDTNRVNIFLNLSSNYKKVNIDSLHLFAEQAYELSKELSFKRGEYSSLSYIGLSYFYMRDFSKALTYYNKTLEVAESLNNDNFISKCFTNIGIVYERLGDFDKAVEIYTKGLKLSEQLNDQEGIARAYVSIGIIHSNKGSFDKANDYYFKALAIREKLNDRSGIAGCFNNIGVVYRKQGSHDLAVKYYTKALEIYKELNDKRIVGYLYNNISIIHDINKAYDKAIEFLNKSIAIKIELNDKIGLASNYSNLGIVYENMGNYEKAIEYKQKNLKIYTEIEDEYGMAHSYWSMAALNQTLADSVATNKKQKEEYLRKTIEYGEKSHKMSQKFDYIFIETNVAKTLMDAYGEIGNFKKAVKFAEIHITTQDSLFNKDKAEVIQEMETKYQTEKKNVEIKELKIKDLENENIKRLFILIIIFLGIISILLFFFFRQKVKTNKVLDKKNYQLNKLNETQSRLMSIISHDLKAPLSAFFSITSSLKSKIDKMDSKAIDEYFNRMLNSALAVKLQLENLLVWSITQTTDINVHKNAYNLSVLVQKVIVILEEFSNEKAIAVDNKVDENIEINTDGRLLSIVLNNITTNAIKFSDKNSNVEIEATKSNGKMRITIKDYGCGMSNENLRNLFDGKNSMKHANKGTGLGLIVCKDIVGKLGGKIWAESEEGKGTTFYIEIDE